eukprot:TRINITY_DN1230_c0_g1_i1.p1 TRINITY_DN1230_c0_g1~~TRINITY_DN1230_c0_g1_i1.p1  ORF type:complete len:248 (+),score=92.65 TRINITY_DN1230_c0_g1_i1:60-803(+)
MKRRGLGAAAAVANKQEKDRRLAELGDDMTRRRMTAARDRLELFREKLKDFASVHGARIKKDPVFRQKFNAMCMQIGVDPLGSGKGLWTSLGLGDFYYELSVQAAEVCMTTRVVNGGVIPLDELTRRVRLKRPAAQRESIRPDDIIHAIRKLETLKSGFKVLDAAAPVFIQSVPIELSTDGLALLSHLSTLERPCATLAQLCTAKAWDDRRTQRAVNDLLQQALLWFDGVDATYWAPSMFLSDTDEA